MFPEEKIAGNKPVNISSIDPRTQNPWPAPTRYAEIREQMQMFWKQRVIQAKIMDEFSAFLDH